MISCLADNAEAMVAFKSAFPKHKDFGGQSKIDRFLTRLEKRELPTKSGLEDLVARLFVRHSMPFSAVDWSELHVLLRYAHSMGEMNVQLELPARRQFVDRSLLGSSGLISTLVQDVPIKHRPYAAPCGSNLMFDGVTDVNKVSLMNFMIQSGNVKTVVLTARAGANRQTADFVAGVARGILQQKVNFNGLDIGGDPLDNEEVAVDDKDQSPLFQAFNKVLSLANTVCFVGSDNASNVQGAISKLEEEFKVVGWGCVAHATSRLAENLCGVLEIIIGSMHDVVDFFMSVTVMKELLRSEARKILIRPCGTRFLSTYLVASRLLEVFDQ